MLSNNPLRNKTILITGASSGIGRELALRLSQTYATEINLILAARNRKKLAEVETLTKSRRTDTLILCTNVADHLSCKRMAKRALARFKKIDILVLNAGVSMYSDMAAIKKITDLTKIMDVNYFGVVYPFFYLLPPLREVKGKVFVISSVQGHLGIPKHSGYSASKHAVHGFIDAVALEEPAISFHKMILGWVRNTSLHENRVLANWEEIKESATVIKKRKRNSMFSVSLKQCVKEIESALSTQKKNYYIPRILSLAGVAKLFFPKLLNTIIKKAIARQRF